MTKEKKKQFKRASKALDRIGTHVNIADTILVDALNDEGNLDTVDTDKFANRLRAIQAELKLAAGAFGIKL